MSALSTAGRLTARHRVIEPGCASGDDLQLVERLGAGDEAALAALMARFSGPMYRLAFGITRSHADAEEVVQDTFLTVIRKGGSFEGRCGLGGWMYRVTTNLALNKRRGKRREVETSLEEMLPRFTDDGHRQGDRSLLVADWSATPERELLCGEARAVLERALDALPAHYRAVLVLRDVEQLSNEAVAATIDETVATVKSRLHRARMALREQLTRRLGADA
jgi:RNA polymerase sigma-70 factor, ECF subfamily